ncbi:hypothetical protein Q3G72_022106 [Acer saccharum]|nr:hypothetical protein Q3G72_022106 [Acer saccharum]
MQEEDLSQPMNGNLTGNDHQSETFGEDVARDLEKGLQKDVDASMLHVAPLSVGASDEKLKKAPHIKNTRGTMRAQTNATNLGQPPMKSSRLQAK